ncbi:hypothetical protein A2V61_04435 [Candidatus Woesebacteria bacterium RBG_19FT_COMBO_47_8]|nr:MAG: hypothetical protein A2V61_04435 [Candidatus Woesebacteria bacterium RBG_19FT_COMBO_47_8]
MKRFFLKFSSLIFPLLLILVTGALAWKNHVPGTILSGWDSLHPEFNLGLYLKRAFWGVWQEHQGVGAVASQAHTAELPRLFIVWLLDIVLPANLVRYSFFFLTLGLGGLGAYFLVKYLLSVHSERFSKEASFLAGLFYILNLATLQQYYVPLEMFAVHFASLPWLVFLAIKYLREGKRRELVHFSLVTVFSSAMAHTPTLFYSYLGALVLFIGSAIVLVKRKALLKRGVLLVGLTLVLNLYWLAPNFYFLVNHADEVTSSKIHRVFSDEAYLQSKAFGDAKNLGLLKNFLFNWREYDFAQGKFVNLMDEWENHLANPGVSQIGYGLAVIAFLGIVVALFRKAKYALALFPVLAACVFFWLNSNPPLGFIFDFLRDRLPLFKEGLRFPFTKFSILLTVCLAVYLGFSAQFTMRLLGKIKLGFLFLLFGASLLVYSMLPAFKGYLISPSMKVEIPQAYFEAFNWFNSQSDKGRIAKLPLNTFWGWNYYSWGYQGAGFSWFGIEEPTFDREFDRWSAFNEDFYNQASSALYSEDLNSFEKALQKYQVRYLLLDESIVNAGGENTVLFIFQTHQLLNSSKHISEITRFGALTIYKTDFEAGGDYILAPKTYTKDAFALMLSDIVAKARPLLGFADIVENLSQDRGFAQAVNCDLLKIGTVEKTHTEKGILYKADGGGVSCDFLEYLSLQYNQGYILRVKGENVQGRSLKIYLYNTGTHRMDLEELLPNGKFDEYFAVLPKTVKGAGYVLNLETRSYGKEGSENILSGVELYKIPLNLSTSLYFDTDNTAKSNELQIKEVNKIAPVLYAVKTEGQGVLGLAQGYEKGWLAFSLRPNFKLLDHLKLNAWANGWEVNSGNQIYIFFWPQLLEFGGILVGLICLALVLRKPRS